MPNQFQLIQDRQNSRFIFRLIFIFFLAKLAHATCQDCIFISNPIEFSHVTIQGEVSRSRLASLSFEERKSFSDSVNSCHDFWDKGLPEDNYMESKAADYYRGFCKRLELLQQFKPANKNYLKDFKLTHIQFLLPTAAHSGGAEEYDQILGSYAEQGLSMADLAQREIVLIQCTSDVDITFIYAGTGTEWIEIARGDFNNDGIEDILIEQDIHSLRGTLGIYNSIILTQTKENGMMEVQEI